MCGMLYNSTTQKVEAGEWLQVQDRPVQRSETIPPQHPALTYSHIYIYISATIYYLGSISAHVKSQAKCVHVMSALGRQRQEPLELVGQPV